MSTIGRKKLGDSAYLVVRRSLHGFAFSIALLSTGASNLYDDTLSEVLRLQESLDGSKRGVEPARESSEILHVADEQSRLVLHEANGVHASILSHAVVAQHSSELDELAVVMLAKAEGRFAEGASEPKSVRELTQKGLRILGVPLGITGATTVVNFPWTRVSSVEVFVWVLTATALALSSAVAFRRNGRVQGAVVGGVSITIAFAVSVFGVRFNTDPRLLLDLRDLRPGLTVLNVGTTALTWFYAWLLLGSDRSLGSHRTNCEILLLEFRAGASRVTSQMLAHAAQAGQSQNAIDELNMLLERRQATACRRFEATLAEVSYA